MNRRAVKIIVSVICVVMALILLMSAFWSALAATAEQDYFEVVDGGCGAIVEMPVDSPISDYEGIVFACNVEKIEDDDDNADLYTSIRSMTQESGYDIDSLYYVYMEVAQDYSDAISAGAIATSSALFTEAPVYYLPVSDEVADYRGLSVFCYDLYSYSSSVVECELVKIDGQYYAKFTGSVFMYCAPMYEVNAEGEPVHLGFWEKGVGLFLAEYWRVIVIGLGLAAFIMVLFVPFKKKGAVADVDAEAPSVADEETAGAGEEKKSAPQKAAAKPAKSEETGETAAAATKVKSAAKPKTKKPATEKTAAAGTEKDEKKPAAKTAVKKPATKKPAAEKTAAKKKAEKKD